MSRVDLHTHSHYSDGTLAPAEVVRRSAASGVKLLVLSDHDTTDGWPEARAEAERLGLDLRPGVEINTVDDNVHVLGYGIDPEHPGFRARLAEFRARRERRIAASIDQLRLAGVAIEHADLKDVSRQTLGRPHIADALRRRNVVGSRREAFERFLTRGKPGYVEPMGPTFEEAVETIRMAGGFASLAHPGQLKNGALDPSKSSGEALSRWVEQGLEGIEVFYLTHSPAFTQDLLAMTRAHGLFATGGSDFHGPGTGREKLGGVEVPAELFEKLRARL